MILNCCLCNEKLKYSIFRKRYECKNWCFSTYYHSDDDEYITEYGFAIIHDNEYYYITGVKNEFDYDGNRNNIYNYTSLLKLNTKPDFNSQDTLLSVVNMYLPIKSNDDIILVFNKLLRLSNFN